MYIKLWNDKEIVSATEWGDLKPAPGLKWLSGHEVPGWSDGNGLWDQAVPYARLGIRVQVPSWNWVLPVGTMRDTAVITISDCSAGGTMDRGQWAVSGKGWKNICQSKSLNRGKHASTIKMKWTFLKQKHKSTIKQAKQPNQPTTSLHCQQGHMQKTLKNVSFSS